jgi:SAM-dependent methyltransferase
MENFENFKEWKEFTRSKNFVQKRNHVRKVNLRFWISLISESYLIGECDICTLKTKFKIDKRHAITNDLGGFSSKFLKKKVNFRERLECSNCHLNQRMRSSIGIVNQLLKSDNSNEIWIQEAITPLYEKLKSKYEKLVGSEYFGLNVQSGTYVNGVRHEDATKSSFEADSLDAILSFDVLEHIPEFKAAFNESCRVLRKGGIYCWSAPFNLNSEKNELRATINSDGQIDYILPPEFHGDPINPNDGILCFQTFGWEVLANLRDAGFSNVHLFWHNNPNKGILSLENVFVIAMKSK